MRTSTLKKRRIDAGIGLRELARKIKVDPSALLRWESGRWKPTEKNLERWQKALAGGAR